MPGALDGLRVLDLTRLLPGAVATAWLVESGAEVIKVEQPPVGDYARATYTALFEETNRGKKSVELDLKTQKEPFLKLLRTADVLIEGFRPGVMERLGLGYEALREINPRLIYVALTGYASDGPHRSLAGHDVNYLAMSGVLDLIRAEDGTPVIPGVQIADLAGGSMRAVIGDFAGIGGSSQKRPRAESGNFDDRRLERAASGGAREGPREVVERKPRLLSRVRRSGKFVRSSGSAGTEILGESVPGAWV